MVSAFESPQDLFDLSHGQLKTNLQGLKTAPSKLTATACAFAP
jgi:hypothetical protein